MEETIHHCVKVYKTIWNCPGTLEIVWRFLIRHVHGCIGALIQVKDIYSFVVNYDLINKGSTVIKLRTFTVNVLCQFQGNIT
jgi:hypothetical protein